MSAEWNPVRACIFNLVAVIAACIFYGDATRTHLMPGAVSTFGLFTSFFLLAGSLVSSAWARRRKDDQSR